MRTAPLLLSLTLLACFALPSLCTESQPTETPKDNPSAPDAKKDPDPEADRRAAELTKKQEQEKERKLNWEKALVARGVKLEDRMGIIDGDPELKAAFEKFNKADFSDPKAAVQAAREMFGTLSTVLTPEQAMQFVAPYLPPGAEHAIQTPDGRSVGVRVVRTGEEPTTRSAQGIAARPEPVSAHASKGWTFDKEGNIVLPPRALSPSAKTLELPAPMSRPVSAITGDLIPTAEEKAAQIAEARTWMAKLFTDVFPGISTGKDLATIGGINPDKALGLSPDGKAPTISDKMWAVPGVVASLIPGGKPVVNTVRKAASEGVPALAKALKTTDAVSDATKLTKAAPLADVLAGKAADFEKYVKNITGNLKISDQTRRTLLDDFLQEHRLLKTDLGDALAKHLFPRSGQSSKAAFSAGESATANSWRTDIPKFIHSGSVKSNQTVYRGMSEGELKSLMEKKGYDWGDPKNRLKCVTTDASAAGVYAGKQEGTGYLVKFTGARTGIEATDTIVPGERQLLGFRTFEVISARSK